MKPVLGVAATGVLALLFWKIAVVFLLPFLGIAIGLAFLAVKVIVIGAMIALAIWVARRWSRSEETPA